MNDFNVKTNTIVGESNMINCPDCKGYGGDRVVDLSDYTECPTCEGIGEVKEGTKGWLQKLIESK